MRELTACNLLNLVQLLLNIFVVESITAHYFYTLISGTSSACLLCFWSHPIIIICDIFFFTLFSLVALAVYNRSPSAYEALHDLKILQLPHSKTIKKVVQGGLENSGIDEDYLQGQQQTYEQFQSTREAEGHPRPLGIGVMMWDEVKV